MSATRPAKFPLGRIVVTPGVAELVFLHRLDPFPYLWRHESGDWGDLDADDRNVNEEALRKDFRLLSAFTTEVAYQSGDFAQLWIITDAERVSTTLLLPEEY